MPALGTNRVLLTGDVGEVPCASVWQVAVSNRAVNKSVIICFMAFVCLVVPSKSMELFLEMQVQPDICRVDPIFIWSFTLSFRREKHIL